MVPLNQTKFWLQLHFSSLLGRWWCLDWPWWSVLIAFPSCWPRCPKTESCLGGKDCIPDLLNSNIVHKYSFPQCSEIYVGKVPDICTHVLLNIGVCLIVLVSLVVTLKAIYANIFLDSGHVVSPSAFSILYSENISSFTVIESIYIHKYFGPVCGWVS